MRTRRKAICDSGLVIQAALLIPDGFGVCRFDTEEYCILEKEQDGAEGEARRAFSSRSDECELCRIKGILEFLKIKKPTLSKYSNHNYVSHWRIS